MLKQNLLRTALFLPSAFIIFLLLLFWFAARNEVFAECGPNNLGEYCEYRGDNWCCGVGYCNQVSSGVCATDGLWPPYYFCEGDDVVDPSRGHDPCVWACGCRPIPPTPTPTDEPTPTPTPEPTATPIPPTPTPNCGQWGPCGSCDSCIGPDSECVFHRKDANEGCEEECLWDYAGCHVEGPTSTPTPTPTPGGPTNTPTPTPTPTGAPNTISGNVYNDPNDTCNPAEAGVSPVSWATSEMRLSGSTPAFPPANLGTGSFSFNGVTSCGIGCGLGIYSQRGAAMVSGLPSGWICSLCNPSCVSRTGVQPGVPPYNFFVQQGANAWFQAQGGDIHGQGSISSPIPTTAPDRNFSRDLNGYPGVVSYKGSLSLKDGQVSSKGWSANSAFVPGQSTYNYFYQKLGSPTEDNFNGDLSAIIADGTYYSADNVTINNDWSFPGSRKAIVLINGKLEINKKINVPQGSFLAFIVKQNIEIKGTVGDKNPIATPHLEGIFLTDGLMKTNYDGDNSGMRLVGSGIFIAHGGFVLGRDLKDTPPVPNSTTPAEFFLFRPDLVLNSPKELWASSMSWVEVAP